MCTLTTYYSKYFSFRQSPLIHLSQFIETIPGLVYSRTGETDFETHPYGTQGSSPPAGSFLPVLCKSSSAALLYLRPYLLLIYGQGSQDARHIQRISTGSPPHPPLSPHTVPWRVRPCARTVVKGCPLPSLPGIFPTWENPTAVILICYLPHK